MLFPVASTSSVCPSPALSPLPLVAQSTPAARSSFGFGWETFKWLQVVGFALLVYGTFMFNDIVRPPIKACLPRDRREGEVLLPEGPIEHI